MAPNWLSVNTMTNADLPRRRLIWLAHRFVETMNWVSPLFGRKRIENITTGELQRLQAKQDRSFVLVDARSEAEIAVSTIPDAINQSDFSARQGELTGKLVIAFCTVGGRSLLFAQRCTEAGFESRNYAAGILGWCASGGQLVGPDGRPTSQVHTHSRLFDVPNGYERIC